MAQLAEKDLPVVLIHGFLETRNIWTDFARTLSSERIITPNLPGVGEEPLPDNLTIDMAADILASQLADQGLQRVNIIGHSLGGYVALAIAQRHPHLINKLGLFHSTAFADSGQKKLIRTKVIQFLKENGLDSFIETFVEPLFHLPNRPRLQPIIKEIKKVAKTISLETAVAYIAAMRDRQDYSPILRQLDPKIAFIGGIYDTAVTLNNSISQTNVLRSPYILMLENSRHMGMFEEAEECSDLINRFLN